MATLHPEASHAAVAWAEEAEEGAKQAMQV